MKRCDVCGEFGVERCKPCADKLRAGLAAHYREELTAAGPQFVIPGCERKPIENGKPAQLGLF